MMNVNRRPFWLDTAPSFDGITHGDLPLRAQAVVVGGGFTGLSAARELARRGVEVVLLEATELMGQASGRNGGHCNTGTSQSMSVLTARYGAEQAARFYHAYADAVDFVESVVHEESLDCDFTRTGKIKLASKPAHYAGLVLAYEALRSTVDQDVTLVPPEEIGQYIGSNSFHGGLIQHRGGQMHMGKFGMGLASAAVRYGAKLYTNCEVQSLTPAGGNAFILNTSRGEIRADRLLLATGCSQRGRLDWWRRRIMPIGSFVIVTEPMDDALIDRVFPGRHTYVTSRIIGNYFRLTADNRLVFGGRARFARSNPASDAKSGRILEAALREYFPALAQTRIDYCWGGEVEMTVDRLPRAGVHEGAYYAMGYSGHGTQMSTYLGALMARQMVGLDADHPWDRGPWPAVPGHAGKAWYLPMAGLYYRIKDKFY